MATVPKFAADVISVPKLPGLILAGVFKFNVITTSPPWA